MSDPQAHYQRVLLELLRRGDDPEAIRRALAADPALHELRGYIEALDPHALAVATELVATWGGTDDPLR